MTENGITLAEIREALKAVENLNLHFDESWDDEGTITAGTWVGGNFLAPDSEVTAEQLEFIGRSRDYVRALLTVCEAIEQLEPVLESLELRSTENKIARSTILEALKALK